MDVLRLYCVPGNTKAKHEVDSLVTLFLRES